MIRIRFRKRRNLEPIISSGEFSTKMIGKLELIFINILSSFYLFY